MTGANASIMDAATSMGLDEDAKPKTVIRALMGIDEDADVEVRSSDAEVIGNEGSVQIEFSIDGDVVAAQGGDSVDWVFANGEWYSEDVIGSGTC